MEYIEEYLEKCPVLKELPQDVLETVVGFLGPESCVKYCYYVDPIVVDIHKATEIIPGRVYYENRVDDLGVYRIYVQSGKGWILFEEEPC